MKKSHFLTLLVTTFGWIIPVVSIVAQSPASPVRTLRDITPRSVSAPRQMPEKPHKKSAAGQTAIGKLSYCWLIYEDEIEEYGSYGLSTLDLKAPEYVNVIYENDYQACAGAYADNRYYAYLYMNNYNGQVVPKNFISMNLEDGSIRQVADYSDITTIYTDMSYDYSTSTLYALGVDDTGTKSVLATVDLDNGNYTPIKTLEQGFLTLAITYSGTCYGISTEGILYKIDKTNGRLTQIGDTKARPTNYQTMEFDHTDETLYWAATFPTESRLYTVDTLNAQLTSLGTTGWYDDSEVTGLYIPFRLIAGTAPAPVTDLKATPVKGTTNARLTWVNPTENAAGTELTSLSKIDIYRNDSLIHTFSEPVAGAFEEWLDETTQTGACTYRLVPANEGGEGRTADIKTYLGEDYAGEIKNFSVVNQDGTAVLSWSAPTSGQYGGWYDDSTLTYKISRRPDFETIAEGITDTTFTDRTMSGPGYYYYVITTYTGKGTGTQYYSETFYIGMPDTIPQFYSFDTEESYKTWRMLDNNNDYERWQQKLVDEKWSASFTASESEADDWLISIPLLLEKDKTYRIKFLAVCDFSFLTPSLEVCLCKNGSDTDTIRLEELQIKDTNFKKKNVVAAVTETGPYSIGFHCNTTTLGAMISITGIMIEEYTDYDLEAVSLDANLNPIATKEYVYTVQVANNGKQEIPEYRVELIKDGEIMDYQDITETLASEATHNIRFNHIFTEEGTASLQAKVTAAGDPNFYNDTTATVTLTIQPADALSIVTIGKGEKTVANLPFGFVYATSVAQTVYLKEELKTETGLIKKIAWRYIFNTDIPDAPVKVYMGNTDRNHLKNAWVPADSLTLVYEGTVSMMQGDEKTLEITLTYPYLYKGGNLCVMTERVLAEQTYTRYGGAFVTTDETTRDRTRSWTGDSGTFNFGSFPTSNSDNVTDITLYIEVTGGVLQGQTTSGNEPLADALIEIEEAGLQRQSDENGNYRFDYVPEGTYCIHVSKDNYKEVRMSDVRLTKEEPVVLNFDLTYWDNLSENKTDRITLYPNPASDFLKIDGNYSGIRITDPLGRTVGFYSHVKYIDIRHLPEGAYFVTIESDKRSEVRKFIINR